MVCSGMVDNEWSERYATPAQDIVWDPDSGSYVRAVKSVSGAAPPGFSSRPISYADVTVLIDESGSMDSMEQGVVDGVNEYVGQMRANPGQNRWTLTFFDTPTGGETFPRVVYQNKAEGELPYLKLSEKILPHMTTYSGFVFGGPRPEPVGCKPIPPDVPTVTYKPRGGTALVDAVCLSLQASRARTSGNEMAKRVMMIVTDGQENSSRQFSTEKMKELVAEEQRLGHEFIFLGANFDAFAVAQQYNAGAAMGSYTGGVVGSGASNSYNYTPTAGGLAQGIASGMVGLFEISSGAMVSGKIGFNKVHTTPLI